MGQFGLRFIFILVPIAIKKEKQNLNVKPKKEFAVDAKMMKR